MQFRFGVFELDEEARELRRAGEPVRIQPKPFELLRLLLRERDRVVSFDELRAALWPETVVSPASLNRAVTHARRALADTRRGRLIRSVPRRGYRFVAAVEESDADERVRTRPPAPGAEESAARGALRAASGRSTAARAERRTADRLGGFVGREDALGRLERALGRVRQGGSGLVLVRGRAGIGKTHLLAVLGRRAAERGFQVCVGRGCDGDGFPAFWPWIQVLRSLVEAPELRDEVRAYARAGNLSALTPVLREFAPDAAHDLDDVASGALPDLSDAQQRFRFFDAARRMLLVCARIRPLMLVLEDLQWVDGGALRLLEHLSVELPGAPVLLAISVREEAREPSHRVLRTLAHLRQQPSCEAIDLGGLSRGEVGELLRIAVGGPVPVDLVSELYGRTEGVPLFVGEAIRLLEERGDLDRPERIPRDGIMLPARAIDLIRRSVEAISSECGALLGAAAVIGRDFPLGLATSVAGLGAEEALDLVDEATRAGLIETVEDTGAITHRFTHALFQEAVYAGLSSRTRARLHQVVAERLEQRHGGALDSVASELAHHHHRALPVGDPQAAFASAIRAARQARRLFAWEQAALHQAQAMAALEHFEAVDPRIRAETLLGLGEAHALSGHRTRRMAAYEQAVDVSRSMGDVELQVEAAIGLCDVSEWSSHSHADAETILRDTLDRVDKDDLLARSRLVARLAYLCVRDRDRSEALAREAVAFARECGSAIALQESLYILHYAIAGPDDLAEREALVSELSRSARAGGAREADVIAALDLACDGLMQGDLEKARRHRTLASELVGRHASPSMTWHMRVWDAGLDLLEGRFAQAEQAAHDALLLGRRLGHPFASACFSGQLSLIQRETSRLGELVDRLEGRTDHPAGASHWAKAVLGRALRDLGQDDRARAVWEDLGSQGFAALNRGIRWNATILEVSMLTAELGEETLARPLLDQLSSAPEQHAVLPIPILYGGPLTHAMAALSLLLGLSDEAMALYDDAIGSASSLGARPTVAHLLIEAAPLHARTGSVARAIGMARDAERLSEELGMEPAEAAARAIRTKLEHRPSNG